MTGYECIIDNENSTQEIKFRKKIIAKNALQLDSRDPLCGKGKQKQGIKARKVKGGKGEKEKGGEETPPK